MKICEQELLLLAILNQTNNNFVVEPHVSAAVLRKWEECLSTFRPGNELPPIGVTIELVDTNFNYAAELNYPELIPLNLEHSIVPKTSRYIRKEMANSYSPKTMSLVNVVTGETEVKDTSQFKWRVA